MSHDVSYTFHFEEYGTEQPGFPTTKTVKHGVTFDSGEAWTAVADEFFNFLSSIYGYRCSPEKYAAQFGPKPPTPWEDE